MEVEIATVLEAMEAVEAEVMTVSALVDMTATDPD